LSWNFGFMNLIVEMANIICRCCIMEERVIKDQPQESTDELKKKLKAQSMQFNNEKVLLEHKNELLKQELAEVKEREIAQAKFHESMFNKSTAFS